MSDEQTIYIGPEDDLTNVRERLERIPARRVTLVMPSKTLLRSLIVWRNLYARAQELGKEVLIISSDPQVRSVAQGARFKVASLESVPPGTKPRPSGRILRPSQAGRGQNSPSTEVRVPPRGLGGQSGSGSWRSRQSSQSPQPSRATSGPVPFAQQPPQPPQRSSPSDESDPYAAMGDHEPPLMGEQRGSVSMDGFDITVDAHPSDHPWMAMLAEDEQGAEGPANPPRAYGSRSHDSFTGKPPLPRRDGERFLDLPSIEDELTQIIPQERSAEPPPRSIRMRASASGPSSAIPPPSSKNSGPQRGSSRPLTRPETSRTDSKGHSGTRADKKGLLSRLFGSNKQKLTNDPVSGTNTATSQARSIIAPPPAGKVSAVAPTPATTPSISNAYPPLSETLPVLPWVGSTDPTPLPGVRKTYIGQRFGNYTMVRLLGGGSFANVYLGQHIHLSTQAAIKVLDIRLADEGIERFRTEAQNLARLDHPNIIRLLDFGIEESVPFLVMPYAPKGTLRDKHPIGTPLPLAPILHYVKHVASALQYAHDQKLIHRDVNPKNILLGRNDEILLSDFGISIIASSASSVPIPIQDNGGTLHYTAPEQLLGQARRTSDQYALGAIVYEWLSGSHLFDGTAKEIVSKHLYVPPPPLRQKIPSISTDIEQAVLKALAKDPTQRFTSIQAFANALEQACK